MRRHTMALLVLLTVTGQACAQAISGTPYLAVQGQAQRDVVPDTFPLQVTISETSMDAAASQARVEGLTKQVIELVEGFRQGDVDIKVANLSITPSHDYDQDTRKQVFKGNTYRRGIDLEFHSLDAMRRLIAALPEGESLQFDTGAFSSSRSARIESELTLEAIEDARAAALGLAAGVGRRLGPVHTISTSGFDLNYSDGGYRHRLVAPAPAPAVMREGNITIRQDVYIVYMLEGATQ